ncbi:MAG: hypothetical protein A2Y57_04340 [Candidatus Woykebacteria bacterium RBG_13_40_7b]|uniref:RNA polymerase sigma-70 region 2 domain-containing protein n=1 Tax=Candidatus Woykebacteria bacterium RBG_13_40_7b TaxID=1802594 RepID=A0A1G1W8C7_9BACT|nr:MAG: hypothetical protein A2Y57_04340 [Candidatus Woykebacteria bacterium RBG_13_40_7b]
MSSTLTADHTVQGGERLEGEFTFEGLYKTLYPRVVAFVYHKVYPDRESAEEITAEVFTRAYAKLGSLRNVECVETWVFSIARNAVNSHWREKGKEEKYLPRFFAKYVLASDTKDPEERLILDERIRLLIAAIKKLTIKEQEVIALVNEGMRNAEIARTLVRSDACVRITKLRAFRKLRRFLTMSEAIEEEVTRRVA